jgi:hypothetical protein
MNKIMKLLHLEKTLQQTEDMQKLNLLQIGKKIQKEEILLLMLFTLII